MGEASKDIKPVDVKTEFRICPACGYESGFHVSFIPQKETESLRMILVCPSCGARFDIGKSV